MTTEIESCVGKYPYSKKIQIRFNKEKISKWKSNNLEYELSYIQ